VVAAGLALTAAPGLLLSSLGMAFGGLSFALYPLCVAHTNDHVPPERRVGATGGLVLVYSAGAAVGPLAGAAAMSAVGPSGLFILIAAATGVTAAFGFWRLAARPAAPKERQQSYQALPRTTPAAAALDPLAPDQT